MSETLLHPPLPPTQAAESAVGGPAGGLAPPCPPAGYDMFDGPARDWLLEQRAEADEQRRLAKAVDRNMARCGSSLEIAVEAVARRRGLTVGAVRYSYDLNRRWSPAELRLLFGPVPRKFSKLPRRMRAAASTRWAIVRAFLDYRSREGAIARSIHLDMLEFLPTGPRVGMTALYRWLDAFERWGMSGLIDLRAATTFRPRRRRGSACDARSSPPPDGDASEHTPPIGGKGGTL